MERIKKILLTNIYLENFAGTELNTLAIAKELIQQGYDVEVATFIYGDPIAYYFRQENISVINLFKQGSIEKHYDLIIANHFPVLTYCLTSGEITADKIVFISNSSFEPVETPPEYINNLTFCLAISNFLIPQLIEYGVQEDKIKLFPNFLMENELSQNGKPGKVLSNLAVISNHVPEDIYLAVDILREKGVTVDIYGVHDTYKLLNAVDLLPYDGILSIGKSVYWALGLGIPSFCYDRFGGPGWIKQQNISTAFDYTFSGKGFKSISLSPDQLANQILNEYSLALTGINFCQNFIIERCRLSTNLKELLAEIESSIPISDPFQGYSKDLIKRRNLAFTNYFRGNFYGYRNEKKRADSLEANIMEITNTKGWKLLVVIRRLFGSFYMRVKNIFSFSLKRSSD